MQKAALRARQAHRLAQAQRVHDRRATDLPTNANVCIVDVDDPYRPEEKISVVISLRDDVLARWREQSDGKGGRLIDKAQFSAGRRWQELWQIAAVGAVRSLDLEKTPVDGRRPADAIAPKQLQAMHQLANCGQALGKEGDLLVRHVLGTEMSIAQAVLLRGLEGKSELSYMARRLRECLETIAKVFHYA